jgi:hypothetical protein
VWMSSRWAKRGCQLAPPERTRPPALAPLGRQPERSPIATLSKSVFELAVHHSKVEVAGSIPVSCSIFVYALSYLQGSVGSV